MFARSLMLLVGISGKLPMPKASDGAELKARNHIIERYIQLQLAEYRRIFRSTDEVSLCYQM
jgi:hypothetical protein